MAGKGKPGRKPKIKTDGRWKPGQSGFPIGKAPKVKGAIELTTAALRTIMEKSFEIEVKDKVYQGTGAEILALRTYELAVIKGDAALIKMIFDRIDGKLVDSGKQQPGTDSRQGRIVEFHYSKEDKASIPPPLPGAEPQGGRERGMGETDDNSRYMPANLLGEKGDFSGRSAVNSEEVEKGREEEDNVEEVDSVPSGIRGVNEEVEERVERAKSREY
jgi:hypothetical protein